jgi:hypothetical protein
MSSVGGVPVRRVRMVGGLLMVPGVVVLSSMYGVFCCLLMVLGCFLGHGVFPLLVARWLALPQRETTNSPVGSYRAAMTEDKLKGAPKFASKTGFASDQTGAGATRLRPVA